jgi:hypothetical protein
MSKIIFENYDKAKMYSLTVPWKLKTCSVGEDCWCRIIVQVEPIKYIHKIGEYNTGEEVN